MNDTQQTPARRSNWVLITTSIVGGAVLLGAIASAAIAGVYMAARGSNSASGSGSGDRAITADVRDLDELDIDAGSADFSVVYDGEGGADTALLVVSGGTREWTMRRDEGALEIDSSRGFFLDWLTFGPDFGQTVVLHLPEQLRDRQMDADLDLSSGSLRVAGVFGELNVEVSSGEAVVAGSARSVDAHLSSGGLEFELADVTEADLEVSSGVMRGELTGEAPRRAELSVSSGSIDLILPDVPYDLRSSVSSGSADNLLRTDPSASRTLDVRVSSGSVMLRPGS